MGVEVACDVVDCDARAPMGETMMGVPLGWTLVMVPLDELEMTRVRRALSAEGFPSDAPGIGFGGSKKLFCCGKHDLPKFKSVR